MVTIINEMNGCTGNIELKAQYTCNPKNALIAYTMQQKRNYNTWTYPKNIDGIFESKIKPHTFYYIDTNRNLIIQAFPN